MKAEPELAIPAMPEGSGSLDGLRKIFAGCPVLHLSQSWLSERDHHFQPASVRLGVSAGRLQVLAELQDTWIYNPIMERNAPAFLHGDTFEIFLKAHNRTDYWELHVTPDNVVLQLHLPDFLGHLSRVAEESGRSLDVDYFLVTEPVFRSHAWRLENAWAVYAEIPLTLFGSGGVPLTLAANFARYDYQPSGKAPILSATAQLSEPLNFHDLRGWSLLHVSLNQPAAPAFSLP